MGLFKTIKNLNIGKDHKDFDFVTNNELIKRQVFQVESKSKQGKFHKKAASVIPAKKNDSKLQPKTKNVN